jgi:hypothetical protein
MRIGNDEIEIADSLVQFPWLSYAQSIALSSGAPSVPPVNPIVAPLVRYRVGYSRVHAYVVA